MNNQSQHIIKARQLQRSFVLLFALALLAGLSAFSATPVSAAAPLANGKALTILYDSRNNVRYYAYIDDNGDIQELSWPYFNTQLTRTNLSRLLGAPRANGRTLAGAMASLVDTPEHQYIYVDTQGHIQEVSATLGANNALQWQLTNLTALTGAPPAELEGLTTLTFGRAYGYIDWNGHLRELRRNSAGQWSVTDLTALTGAPPAAARSLTGYHSLSFGSDQYAYIDLSGRLHEIYRFGTGAWQTANLSALSGAPTASIYKLVGANSLSYDRKDYVFVDTNRHLWEVYYETGGSWRSRDITARTGAQLASSLSLALFWEPTSPSTLGGARHLAFADASGYVWVISTYPLYNQEYLRTFSLPRSDLALTSYKTGFGYVDRSGHIQEIRLATMWELYDITQRVLN